MNTFAEQVKAASQGAIASAAAQDQPTDSSAEQSASSQEAMANAVSSAEKPAYLSTVTDEDWASASERERSNMIKMGKSLYEDYQRKNKEYSTGRKIQAELEADPGLADAVTKAVNDYRAGIKPAAQSAPISQAKAAAAVAEAGDLIDELKANEDPAVRAQALKLEQAINKRVSGTDPALKGEVELLKSIVADLRGSASMSKQQETESRIDSLSAAWTPAIDRYREKIIAKAVANPKVSFEHILMLTLSPSEYKAAVVADASIETKKTVNRAKQDPSLIKEPSKSAGSRLVSAADTKQSGFAKRTNFGAVVAKMVPELMKNRPRE